MTVKVHGHTYGRWHPGDGLLLAGTGDRMLRDGRTLSLILVAGRSCKGCCLEPHQAFDICLQLNLLRENLLFDSCHAYSGHGTLQWQQTS